MMKEIIEQLKALVLMVEPNAGFVEKYGGLVVESRPGQAKSQFCGIFAYANHLSLELTHGAELDDPQHILQGSGKYRRHIKITRLSDISDKRCAEFLREARGLQGALP